MTEEADPDSKADRILHIMPKSFKTQTRETVLVKARGKDGMKAGRRLHIVVQP